MLRKNFPGRKNHRRMVAADSLVRHRKREIIWLEQNPEDQISIKALRRIERELTTLHERIERA